MRCPLRAGSAGAARGAQPCCLASPVPRANPAAASLPRQTGEVVAIKKIQVGEKGEGVNVTALREVKLLRELRSPYLVRLLEVLPQKKGINLVGGPVKRRGGCSGRWPLRLARRRLTAWLSWHGWRGRDSR